MSATIAKFYDYQERPPRGGWIAAVDGREYQAKSEADLAERIRQDWQNNNRPFVIADIYAAMWAYFRRNEPTRATTEVNAAQITAADGSRPYDWRVSDGPEKWRELHLHAAALVRDGALNEANERNWLQYFSRSIGCLDCRLNWQTELGKLPPDYSSPAAFFAWTVAAHNAVNDRLGKPQFLLSDAQALYAL